MRCQGLKVVGAIGMDPLVIEPGGELAFQSAGGTEMAANSRHREPGREGGPIDSCNVGAAHLILDFHLEIKSQVDLLDETIQQIMELIRLLPCVGGDMGDMELALAEALANANLHGNRQDPNKKVQVCGGCERSE